MFINIADTTGDMGNIMVDLGNQTRPPWPEVGMCCPVAGCPDFFTHFKVFREFIQHWIDRHVKSHKKWKCSTPKCNFKNRDKKKMERHHINRSHKGMELRNFLNDKYINPKGLLPPIKFNTNAVQQEQPSESLSSASPTADSTRIVSTSRFHVCHLSMHNEYTLTNTGYIHLP